jgi:hypothetical protein
MQPLWQGALLPCLLERTTLLVFLSSPARRRRFGILIISLTLEILFDFILEVFLLFIEGK